MSRKYICPHCASDEISFKTERSIDGYSYVCCDCCEWEHRVPNRLRYSDAQLYERGVAAYRSSNYSDSIAYKDEPSTTDELLKEILAELKKTNDYIYRHEQNRIAQDVKEHEKVLHSMRAEKEFAENVLPHAGVGYLGDKEESDEY